MTLKVFAKLFALLALLGILLLQLPDWVREHPQGGAFRLQGAHGSVQLQDFHGHWLVLYFGYTRCPDVCPTNLAIWANVFQRLSPAEREKVRFLFISLDDVHDSADKVHDYVTFFDQQFMGATADAEMLAKVAEAYGVKYRRVAVDSAMGEVLDHSSFSYWLNPKGEIKRMFNHATDPDVLLRVMRQDWQKIP